MFIATAGIVASVARVAIAAIQAINGQPISGTNK